MKLADLPWPFWAGLGVLAAVLINRATGGAAFRAIGEAVPGAVADAGAGIVYGVGDAVGLPRTDATQCQSLLAGGDVWGASLKCPAGDFLGGVWGAVIRNQPDSAPVDARFYQDRYDPIDGRAYRWNGTEWVPVE